MVENNLFYDKKYLIRCLAGLFGVIAVMYVTGGAGFLVAFAILFTCVSRNNTDLLFYTLLMTIAITMGNSHIVHKGGIFSIAQRILMLVLAAIMIVRIAGSRKSPFLMPFLSLLFYVFYMVIPSAAGWNPVISFLKIFLFAMVYTAYFGVANSVINSPQSDSRKIRSIFLMLSVFFIFGSVALIPFPSLSQLAWEQIEEMMKSGQEITSLFTGMTLHSQSLGPVCSAIGVLLFADLAFSIRRPDRLYIALLVCVPILIWKTSSRTAMGSFVAGICFVMLFFMRARGIRGSWKSKVTSTFMMITIAISLIVLAAPTAREKAIGFILKFNGDQSKELTFDEVTSSRRGKWDIAMYNFKQKPVLGNGFQVSEALIGVKAGLTTMSAPVEKGVWVSAILEEGGVCGFILFTLVAMGVIVSLSNHKCYEGLAAFLMVLLTNLGEFTMFSMTSVGGMLWGLVFTGVILDAQRMRDERMRNQYARVRYGA